MAQFRFASTLSLGFLLGTVFVFMFVHGEETGYSIENNRVLKLLAEADAKRLQTTTPAPLAPSTGSTSTGIVSNISHIEYERIVEEVKRLKSAIIRMQQIGHLDEQVQKCIASLQRNIDYKARAHWQVIVDELMQMHAFDFENEVEQDTATQQSHESFDTEAMEHEKAMMLRKIVIGSYEGLRSNILPLVHFINYTEIISGFQPLLQEMRDYDHIYYGNEIFRIARLLRLWCGTDSRLYEELPVGIQYIDSYSVQLLNENNQGLLYHKSRTPCRGRHCTNHELFTFHKSLPAFGQEETERTTWTFIPTNTTDSVWSPYLKFYMKSEFLEKQNVPDTDTMDTTDNVSTNSSSHKYLYVDYEYRMRPNTKSIVIVNLVNHTEDAVRIRVEQSHLIKRLIMGTKNPGKSSLNKLSIMGTEDRFESANDGNWVVIPVRKLNSTVLKDKALWNKNVQCSI